MLPLRVDTLTLSTIGKIFSRRHIEILFSYFSQKTGFDTPCTFIANGDNWHKMTNSGKIRKITNLKSAELAQRVGKFNVQEKIYG